MTTQVFAGTTLQELATMASPLLLLVCLRVLPSLAYVLFSRELSLLKKLLGATAFAPLLIVTTRVFGSALLHIALGLAYYCGCVCVLYRAIPALRARRITPAALFWVNTFLFLVL